MKKFKAAFAALVLMLAAGVALAGGYWQQATVVCIVGNFAMCTNGSLIELDPWGDGVHMSGMCFPAHPLPDDSGTM